MAERRELKLDGETWSIELAESRCVIDAGERRSTRVFSSPEQAAQTFQKLIAEKLAEGWLEDRPSGPSQAAPAGQPEKSFAPANLNLEQHKKEWLENLSSNASLMMTLLNKAMKSGVDIGTAAEAYYDEHVAPQARAAVVTAAPAASSGSKLAVTLGSTGFPLHGPVRQVVLGKRLGVVTTLPDNATLALYDVASGAPVRELVVTLAVEKLDQCSVSARASGDGAYFAVMGPLDQTIALWDVAAGQKARELVLHGREEWPTSFGPYRPNKAGTVMLAFSADASRLAAFDGGRIQIWDVETGQEKLAMKCQVCSRLSLSPDGGSVAWCAGKQLHIQPLDGIARTLQGSWSHPSGLEWSPRGDRIAVLEHRKVHLLRPDSDEIVGLETPDSSGNCFAQAFSPDGSRLYAGGDDTPLTCWLLDEGNKCYQWPRLGFNLASLAAAPDNEWLWLGFGTVDTWNLPAGQLIRAHLSASSFETVAEFGFRILTADDRRRVILDDSPDKWLRADLRVWSLDRKAPQPLGRRREGTVSMLSPTGERVAFSNQPPGAQGESKVTIRPLGDGREMTIPVLSGIPYGFSQDGKMLLSFNGSEARLFSREKIWIRPLKSTHGVQAACLAGNADLTRVALACAGSVQMVDPATDQLLWEHEWSTEGQIQENTTSFQAETYVRILADGTSVVACYNEASQRDVVVFLNATSGEVRGTFEVKHDFTLELFRFLTRLWLPSARRVALPAEGGYAVLDVTTGAQECLIPARTDFLRTGYPMLSADSSFLAVPEPGRVKIYSLPDGRLMDELKTQTPSTAPISMTWMPRGFRLVTQGPGSSYQVWQVLEEAAGDEPEAVPTRPRPVQVGIVIGSDGSVSYEQA